MNKRKYLVETYVYHGDRYVEFFDTLEDAKTRYADILHHLTDSERKNREILIGCVERTSKYIDEDYLKEDNWYEWYTGYDVYEAEEV